MSTRKTCAHCGSDALIRLSSIDSLLCNNCKQYTNWKLKPSEASMLIEGRIGEDGESPVMGCVTRTPAELEMDDD
jgi:hypothetical protein